MKATNKQQTLTLTKPNKAYKKLMEQATKHAGKFLTGEPLAVLKYGRYDDGRISFITFETTGGIEETYNHEDCLAMAVEDSVKIITFNLK